jgi:hypothetical protein
LYSFVETCGVSFLSPTFFEIIIHDSFLCSFAFVTKPLGKFVSILAYACCVSFLFPNFLEIIIQEFFLYSFARVCCASLLSLSFLETIIQEFFFLMMIAKPRRIPCQLGSTNTKHHLQ